MAIEDRIRRFIIDGLHWRGEPSQLTDDFRLIDGGVMDSLGIFQTIAHLEQNEGIEVADEDLIPDNFSSIRAIAALVAAKSGS
jgi:acyl carrier protein